jgi:hypothetical protein
MDEVIGSKFNRKALEKNIDKISKCAGSKYQLRPRT